MFESDSFKLVLAFKFPLLNHLPDLILVQLLLIIKLVLNINALSNDSLVLVFDIFIFAFDMFVFNSEQFQF